MLWTRPGAPGARQRGKLPGSRRYGYAICGRMWESDLLKILASFKEPELSFVIVQYTQEHGWLIKIRKKLRRAAGDQRLIRMRLTAVAPFRRSLAALCQIYWSGKQGTMPIQHLARVRRRPIKILESGIGGYESPTRGGASLRMRCRHLTRGQIHGIDSFEKDVGLPGMHVRPGEQSDLEHLNRYGRTCGPLGVIVDDRSYLTSMSAFRSSGLRTVPKARCNVCHRRHDDAYQTARCCVVPC